MKHHLIRIVIPILIGISQLACATTSTLVTENVTVRGDHAVVTLATQHTLAGELILRENDSLWLGAVDGHLYTVPMQDIVDVEIFDTKISAYAGPTLLTFVGSWTAIGLAGLSYTGDSGYMIYSLFGAALALVPIAANEGGMSNPHYDLNEIRSGELQQFTRYPFSPISPDIRSRLLEQHKQTEPMPFPPSSAVSGPR